MNTKTIRWGILGTGWVAGQFAQALRSLPHTQLAAVASRSAQTAQAFAARFSGVRAYGSYEELVADPTVDVVYIATPHLRHKQDCLLALGAGKPVLCEKPFALDATEAREVAALARRKGLFCMEALWTRFMPQVAEAARLLKEGAIGEVRLLEAQFGYAVAYDPAHRLFSPEKGGGALWDRGVYPVSLAFQLLGRPEKVLGAASVCATGADDLCHIVLQYSGGRTAVLSAATAVDLSNEVVIRGSHGTLRIHAPFYKPVRVSVTRSQPQEAPSGAASGTGLLGRLKQSAGFQWLASGPLNSLRSALKTRSQFRPLAGNGYGYEALEVMRCLREGLTESPLMPLDETVAVLEVMDSVLQSWGRA